MVPTARRLSKTASQAHLALGASVKRCMLLRYIAAFRGLQRLLTLRLTAAIWCRDQAAFVTHLATSRCRMFNYMLSLIPPLYAKGKQFTGYVKALADELEEFIDAAKGTSKGWVTLHAGTYALNALGRSAGLVWPDWADNEQY